MNRNLSFKSRGVTGSSYGLVVGLIAIVALGALTTSGSSITQLFTETGDTLQTVVDGQAEATPAVVVNGVEFAALGDQALGQQVTSETITVTGSFPSQQVSISGDGNPEFSVNGDSFSDSSRSIAPGQTLQLRMTTPSQASTLSTVTVTVGDVSADWNVTTAIPASSLIVGDTSTTVERDGFQVRCDSWTGNTCRAPRVNPVNANDWRSTASSHGSNPETDEWMQLWWGSTTRIAENFCYWATGDHTVLSESTLNQTTIPTSTSSNSIIIYSGCSTSYAPCYEGNYTNPSSGLANSMATMNNTGSTHSVIMECQGW